MAGLDLEFHLARGQVRDTRVRLGLWLGDDTGSPGPRIDVASGIELGYSYELGSGQTRIRVMTRPR